MQIMVGNNGSRSVSERVAVASTRYKLPHILIGAILLCAAYQIVIPVQQQYQASSAMYQLDSSQIGSSIPGFLTHRTGSMFGLYQQQALSVPLTSLPIKLQGVGVAAGSGQGGWALIATRDGEVAGYEVGDHLPGGVTIQSIKSQQVLLLNKGRLERLEMKVPTVKVF